MADKETKECIIIGGGYSIIDQCQVDNIKNSKLFKIGCNKVFETFNIDCLAYFDWKFEKVWHDKIKVLNCEKIAPHNPCEIENKFTDLGTTYIEESKRPQLNAREGYYTGYNTGTFATQIAIIKGFTKIYLLGMDCMLINGQTHHHGGYGVKGITNETYSKMIWTFEILGKFAKEHGIEIVNCSYNSLLDRDIFPYDRCFNG